MNILQVILPPNQSRIIEQAKFTYSPLGKAFEKQMPIRAIEENGNQLVKSGEEKDSLTFLKQKEIFDKLANEERYEKQNLSKESRKAVQNILVFLNFH